MKKRYLYLPIKATLALFTLGLLSIVGCYPGEVQVEPDSGSINSSSGGGGGSIPVSDRISTAPPPTPTAVPSLLPEPVILESTIEPEPTVEVDPFTDPASILATIIEFAALEESSLLGQRGWVHVRNTEVFTLDRNDGDFRDVDTSIPTSMLLPSESPVFESWFHVDETGTFTEALGLVTSTDGRIYQHTVFFDGKSVNVTLKENGFTHYSMAQASEKVHLPTSNVANELQAIYQSPLVTLTAQLTEGHYILTWESEYQEPIEINTPNLPGLAVGDKQIYSFDPQTGYLLSLELYFYLEDGSLIQAIGTTMEAEFIAELPPDKASLYYDTVNTLKNE